jgi:hypothetical protein
MPALGAGIHVFLHGKIKDVDGRDKPGHDGALSRFKSAPDVTPAPPPPAHAMRVGACKRDSPGILSTTKCS